MLVFKRLLYTLFFLVIPGIMRAQKVFDVALYNTKQQNIEYEKIDKEVDTLAFSVTNPTIKVFIPLRQSKKKQAVLICPGGGYHTLLMSREGYRIAREFNKHGIVAIVLKYRLPNIISDITEKPLAPVRDIQKSIMIIRESCKEWGINIKKLGVMGFSAGGHLAGFAATHYEFPFIQNPGHINLRPDFAFLINPIVSMKDSLGHMGSRDNFIGKNPSLDKIYFYSNEMFVNNHTPPIFISHAKDDSVVPVNNSIILAEKLNSYKVKNKLVLYDKGNHGYLQDPSFSKWFSDCMNWLTNLR